MKKGIYKSMLQNYKNNFARFNSKYVSRGMYIMLIFYNIILNAYFVHKKTEW